MSWRLNDEETLVSRWLLQGDGRDVTGRYPGTPANMQGWPPSGPFGQLTCAELNGNNSNINLGDIAELNSVSAFTLCLWANQDVIDVTDRIFYKFDTINRYMAWYSNSGDGNMYFVMRPDVVSNSYVTFDYSTVMFAGMWHHLAAVYDGTQAVGTERFDIYVDGTPMALTFSLDFPATSPDLSGIDAYLGHTSNSWDGRLWDTRLYNVPLSRDEVNKIIHGPVPVV